VTITVPFDDIPSLTDLPQRAFNSAAYQATRDIQDAAWGIVPFRTGQLIESMKVRVGVNEITISFDRRGGLSRKQIAGVIDRGAAPHTIVAKQAKALRLQDGRFRYKVEHPGYGGRGYILKMKEVARQILTRRLLEALRNWRSI